jgi:hypothetical protein
MLKRKAGTNLWQNKTFVNAKNGHSHGSRKSTQLQGAMNTREESVKSYKRSRKRIDNVTTSSKGWINQFLNNWILILILQLLTLRTRLV